MIKKSLTEKVTSESRSEWQEDSHVKTWDQSTSDRGSSYIQSEAEKNMAYLNNRQEAKGGTLGWPRNRVVENEVYQIVRVRSCRVCGKELALF